jgi:metalloendopeptidase OMA1, mitochondrial
MSEAMLMQTGGQVLGSAVSAYDPGWTQAAMMAYGVGAQLGRQLPHSRAQETEADHIGLIYMARAGYNPRESIGFWERFMAYNEERGSANVPAFLRTHPVDKVRIEQLEKLMPEADAEFQRSKLQ